MNKFKKILSGILATLMVIGSINLAPLSVKAEEKTAFSDRAGIFAENFTKYREGDEFRALRQKYGITDTKVYSEDENSRKLGNNEKEISDDDQVRVIVQLKAPSLYELSKTNKVPMSQASSLRASVVNSQLAVKSRLTEFGSIRHTYNTLINGFSATVRFGDINEIRNIPGVKNVTVANKYFMNMNTAINITKAKQVWEGTYKLKGEGTVISIVDSGIDYTHKDMRLTDPSKAKLNKDNVALLGGPGKYFTEKVPYGWNFADNNDRVIPQQSMHGMHVAGIAGANGTDEEVNLLQAVKGVAPEAQLLAMKVFTNNPDMPSCFSDDVAAAIEDSYKHNADVINLSLGSDAGFINPNDPEQIAVKNAIDAGTVVVIAAGNAFYSNYYLDFIYDVNSTSTMDPDISTYGSPATSVDCLGVAAIENSHVTMSMVDYSSDKESGSIEYLFGEVDPSYVLKDKYELVFCGLGRENDFIGKDLTGKVALIERGILTFADKTNNAAAAGAEGVIIYNSAAYGNTNFTMPSDPTVTIPRISIKRNKGEALKALISQNVKVEFAGKKTVEESPAKGQVCDFSSWGSQGDLAFSPEITAPGENIYSTVNDDKYEIMGGTSMASPHTAGAAALVVQHLKNDLKVTAEKRDFVILAKNLMISTAVPQIEAITGLPYLTRKQGAGLLQIDKAIATNAYAFGQDGNATLALKEIGNKTEATVSIKNIGSKDLTFVPADKYGVLTNYVQAGSLFPNSAKIANAKVSFDKTEVVVPAGGVGQFKITIDIPATTNKNIFAEGFITLTEKNDANVEIGIPYMGFYGKWSGNEAPRIFDAPRYTQDTFFGMTGLTGVNPDDLYFLGDEKTIETFAFSPNNDKYFDSISPIVSFMRNAKEYKVQILDANGNVVREVFYGTNKKKNVVDVAVSSAGRYIPKGHFYQNDSWNWDGTIYNGATGKLEIAPEGHYTVRFTARPDFEGSSWSNLDMPVKIDITRPTVRVKGELLEHNQYKIINSSTDNEGGSGIAGYSAFVIDKEENILSRQALEFVDNQAIITLPNAECSVVVFAMDYAQNEAYEILDLVNNANLQWNLEKTLYNTNNIKLDYNVINGELVSKLDHFNIKVDELAVVNNGVNLSYEIKGLTDGQHVITVTAVDAQGNYLCELSKKIYVDTVKPVLTYDEKWTDKEMLEDGSVKYTHYFFISEMEETDTGYTFVKVNGTIINPVKEGVEPEVIKDEKLFRYVHIAPEGKSSVNIEVSDLAGNMTTKLIEHEVTIDQPLFSITKPEVTTIQGLTVDLEGKIAYKAGQTITGLKVDGKDVAVTNGSFATSVTYTEYGNKEIVLEATASDNVKAVRKLAVVVSPFNIAERQALTNKNEYTINYSMVTIPKASEVRISVNGGAPQVTTGAALTEVYTGTTVKAEGLAEGSNTVAFEVLDAEHNVIASDLVEVLVDTVRPLLNIVDENGKNIEEYMVYTKNEMGVKGTVSEPVKYLKINDVVFAVDKDNKFEGKLALADGVNRFEVSMEDMAGNIENYVFRADVDTQMPVITMEAPTTEEVITDKDIYTIKFKVKDNTYTQNIYINGQAVPEMVIDYEGTGKTEQNVSYDYTVPFGKSIVTIEVIDDFGIKAKKQITFHKIYNQAIVLDKEFAFDKNDPQDVYVGTVFNGDTLQGIRVFNTPIKSIEAYTVYGNNIVLNRNFLNQFPTNRVPVELIFASGLVETIYITVSDTNNALTIETVGNNPTFLKGKDGKVVLKATNITSTSKKATVILALYDANGSFVSYVSGSYSIAAGDSIEMSAMLSIPANANGYKVKCFVWDTMDGMKPLSAVREFSVQ